MAPEKRHSILLEIFLLTISSISEDVTKTQCDPEQTNSFFQVFYSCFVDQSCEAFIKSSDYREALSLCTTRSVFGLHHRRIFRKRFRSISEEERTAAQTFLLSHTLLKLKVLHNATSLIKYPNINPAHDQMFKQKKNTTFSVVINPR